MLFRILVVESVLGSCGRGSSGEVDSSFWQ